MHMVAIYLKSNFFDTFCASVSLSAALLYRYYLRQISITNP